MSDKQLAKKNDQAMEFTPVGETSPIKLTIDMTRRFLTTPTRSGKQPSDADVVKFMMLCKSRGLNPWVGDAYLVGYDGKDGPQFSLITAHQALLKRAEISPDFDGMQSGVIIVTADGEFEHREGDFVDTGEQLVGGWARVYRKDRKYPFYEALNLDRYNSGRSQWAKDPAGMICKCAEGSALRKAFPSMCGGLYTQGEQHLMESVATAQPEPKRLSAKAMTLDDLASVPQPVAAEAVNVDAEPDEGEA